MIRGIARVGVAGLAAALALTACSSSGRGSKSTGTGGGSSSAAAGKNFTFVYESGISGALASVAALEISGMNVAIDELNKTGGINGHHIVLKTLDDQGSATTAVSVLQQYISGGGGMDAILAGLTSPETLAMLPVLTRAKTISMAGAVNTTLNDPSKYPYHFGIAPDAATELKTLLPQLTKISAKSLSALLPNDATGQTEYAAVQAALKGSGISVTETTYDPTAVNLTVPYAKAASGKPDALFLDAEGSAEGPLLNARLKVPGATDIATFGGPALAGVPPISLAPASALGNFLMPELSGLVQKSGAKSAALIAVQGANDYKGQSIIAAAFGYDVVQIVALGAKQAKSIDSAAIKTALEANPTIAVGNLITETDLGYSSTDHFPTGSYEWIQAASTVSGGLWVPAGS
jgi:branched-chain amino acid transport system substrate-binding protein